MNDRVLTGPAKNHPRLIEWHIRGQLFKAENALVIMWPGWSLFHSRPDMNGSLHLVGRVAGYANPAAAQAAAQRHCDLLEDTGNCDGGVLLSRGAGLAIHCTKQAADTTTACGLPLADRGYQRISAEQRPWWRGLTCRRCQTSFGFPRGTR